MKVERHRDPLRGGGSSLSFAGPGCRFCQNVVGGARIPGGQPPQKLFRLGLQAGVDSRASTNRSTSPDGPSRRDHEMFSGKIQDEDRRSYRKHRGGEYGGRHGPQQGWSCCSRADRDIAGCRGTPCGCLFNLGQGAGDVLVRRLELGVGVRQPVGLRMPWIEGHPAKRRTGRIGSQVTGVCVGELRDWIMRGAEPACFGAEHVFLPVPAPANLLEHPWMFSHPRSSRSSCGEASDPSGKKRSVWSGCKRRGRRRHNGSSDKIS